MHRRPAGRYQARQAETGEPRSRGAESQELVLCRGDAEEAVAQAVAQEVIQPARARRIRAEAEEPLPNPLLKPLPKFEKVGLNMSKKGPVGRVAVLVMVDGNPKKFPRVLDTFWKVLLNAELTAGKKSVLLVVGTPASAEKRLVKVVPVPVPVPIVPCPVPVVPVPVVPVPVPAFQIPELKKILVRGVSDVRS